MIDDLKISVGIITTTYDWDISKRERYKSVMNTWGKDNDIYYFGGIKSDNPDNLILLDVDDSYNGMLYKQNEILKYFYKNVISDWYYIAADDTYFYKEHALDMLKKYNTEEKYYIGGHYGLIDRRFKTEYQSEFKNKKFPAGGAGFFINRTLLEYIVNDLDKFADDWKLMCETKTTNNIFYACDFAFAIMMLLYYNIDVTIEQGFYGLQPYRYPHTNDEFGTLYLIDNPISYHNISPTEMYKLYNNSKNNIYKI